MTSINGGDDDDDVPLLQRPAGGGLPIQQRVSGGVTVAVETVGASLGTVCAFLYLLIGAFVIKDSTAPCCVIHDLMKGSVDQTIAVVTGVGGVGTLAWITAVFASRSRGGFSQHGATISFSPLFVYATCRASCTRLRVAHASSPPLFFLDPLITSTSLFVCFKRTLVVILGLLLVSGIACFILLELDVEYTINGNSTGTPTRCKIHQHQKLNMTMALVSLLVVGLVIELLMASVRCSGQFTSSANLSMCSRILVANYCHTLKFKIINRLVHPQINADIAQQQKQQS